SDLALLHFRARRFHDAARVARRNLEIDPDDSFTLGVLASSLSRLGRGKETLEVLNHLLRRLGQPATETAPEAAWRSLADLLEAEAEHGGGGAGLVDRAALRLHTGGSADAVLELLEQACAKGGDWGLPAVYVDPRFDRLWRERPEAETSGCWYPGTDSVPIAR
ncbi:MAG: hypothetical protein MI919_14135, partial [Holophagales bacterium]|nr:hypothetical protein [Holophagales bacterium]